MTKTTRILITPGDPAGIGPDVTIQAAQRTWPAELVTIADPDLLTQRAKQIGLPLRLIECDLKSSPKPQQAGTLNIVPTLLNMDAEAGKLNPANSWYVIRSLETAISLCQQQLANALVTGPVNKQVINKTGVPFTGHTEFLASHCNIDHTVMLFVTDQFKVALATTHVPIAKLPKAITKERLQGVLNVLIDGLKTHFQLTAPTIYVCGLNPHAGEGGFLGSEEIEIISPAIETLDKKGAKIIGPLPADTIFTPKYLQNADAILSMYHDQALPLVKYASFGHAVNLTLGLPFIRTSVDHGTAYDIAGTGKADPGSMAAAIELSVSLNK